MYFDPQPNPEYCTTFTYFREDPTVARDASAEPGPIEPAPPEPPPPFTFEHDREKGVFRLRWSDGEVEVFRDKPIRHLVVEPDAETGEIRPVLKRGGPTYLYLCREEREVR